MRKTVIMALACAVFASPVGGYTIGQLNPIHERLTLMSEQCLAFGGQSIPTSYGGRVQCPFDEPTLRAARKYLSRHPHKQTPLEEAARWGDDPGRGLRRFGRGSDYLWQLELTCDRQVRDRDDPQKFLPIYQAGVMCSGHYGKLGFFHAMMSSDDNAAIIKVRTTGGNVGRAMADAMAKTRAKILAWASFTYRVASGDLKASSRFCSAVSADPALNDAFGDGNMCRKADARWTIGTFFTFACANPKLDPICPALANTADAPDGSNPTAQVAALGSLLHMIQDSYAQGHVRRVDQPERIGKKLAPIIACAAPRQYYYYDAANRDDGHGKADSEPRIRGCNKSRVDDPVSAGATVLWLLRSGRSDSDLIAYLEDRVFPLTDN